MYIVGTYSTVGAPSCLETYFWCILSVQNIPKSYLKFVSYSKQSDSWAILCTACVFKAISLPSPTEKNQLNINTCMLVYTSSQQYRARV